MTADAAPVTLVWLAPEPPDAAARRALLGWAQAHGVVLEPPRDAPPPGAAAFAASAASASGAGIAASIEDLLDRARDATAARDGDAALRAIDAAEALLRAHPELPQAAWLMAEVERARATRWRRAGTEDAEAADRAWSRAAALDGGRVAGIAEAPSSAAPADAELTLELPGASPARPSRQLWLDGRAVAASPATIATHAGPHTLVVTESGAPLWARWIDVAPGRSSFGIDLPAPPPCSTADASGAELVGAEVRAAGVRCPRWVAAAPAGATGVRLAACEAGSCAPFVERLEWRDAADAASTTPRAGAPSDGGARPGGRWPAWATWAIVAGAGAAIAAGAIVIAGGAFQSGPTETRFVSGGLKGE